MTPTPLLGNDDLYRHGKAAFELSLALKSFMVVPSLSLEEKQACMAGCFRMQDRQRRCIQELERRKGQGDE